MLSLRSIRGLAVLMVSLSATPALAELGYLEYSAGVAILRNQSLTGADRIGSGLSGRIESEPGFSVGAAVGTTALELYGAALRAEIAVNYRNNKVDRMGVTGQNNDASGDLDLFTAMVNAFVDYDLGLYVVPYVGVGVGYGRVDVNVENRGSTFRINDQASVFAWNVMIGGVLPLSDVVDVTTGYRYVATTDPRLDSRITSTGTTPTVTGQRFDFEYDAHEVVMGLRVNF